MKQTLFAILVTLLAFGGTPAIAQDKEVAQIQEAMPAKTTVKPSKKHKVLVYSKPSGFRHGSIPIGIKALRVMAEKTGAFEATFTLETTEFTAEGLKKYDAIILNCVNSITYDTIFIKQTIGFIVN